MADNTAIRQRLTKLPNLIVFIDTLEVLLRSGGCDLIDEKVFEGPTTPAGILCRLTAWGAYLLAVLLCEGVTFSDDCCRKAERQYCEDWEACPA